MSPAIPSNIETLVSSPIAAYAALSARDARFDGQWFVGVTSTRIYCRPVCRVRMPKAENCQFFLHAAQAEQAGFRPCLKCRPELAPGRGCSANAVSDLDGRGECAPVDASAVLVRRVLAKIQLHLQRGIDLSFAALAAELGVTDRHLRRVFARALGVAPQAWWQTSRLLLAKQLLSDTRLPVTAVALESGFSSLRRFNSAWVAAYRLSPSQLRAVERSPAISASAECQVRLSYRPPFDQERLLNYFARHQLSSVERVESGNTGAKLRRSFALRDRSGAMVSGWIELTFLPDRHQLLLALAPSLSPRLAEVIARVRQAFDLDADPAPIADLQARLPWPSAPGLRLAGGFDGFETAVRVLLGQQVSVSQANALTARLVTRFGAAVETPWPAINRLFPSAEQLAVIDGDEIARIGMPRARGRSIHALAQAVARGELDLSSHADPLATQRALLALPGIGAWSVGCILLRALSWPDAFPASDIGLWRAWQALTEQAPTRLDAARLAEAMAGFRPWRSYVAESLWAQHAAARQMPIAGT
jgi:AraC family transcriptional regulator, regulatory protein of adaptative response / DNA-3-methyladenine glycosylase II